MKKDVSKEEWLKTLFDIPQVVNAVRIIVPNSKIDFIADGYIRSLQYKENFKVDIRTVETPEQALRLWKVLLSWNPRSPLSVKQEKLRYMVKVLTEQFDITDKTGIIVHLKRLTGLSRRQIYRLLPEDMKDESYKHKIGVMMTPKKSVNCANCPYKLEADKKALELLNTMDTHTLVDVLLNRSLSEVDITKLKAYIDEILAAKREATRERVQEYRLEKKQELEEKYEKEQEGLLGYPVGRCQQLMDWLVSMDIGCGSDGTVVDNIVINGVKYSFDMSKMTVEEAKQQILKLLGKQ